MTSYNGTPERIGDAMLRHRLVKAIAKGQPVTLTYIKKDGSETLRTVELYEFFTTMEGHLVIRGMDRQSKQPRTWRTDRIKAFTFHRQGRRMLPVPATKDDR